MKKKVIKALFVLFLLFLIGGGFALFSLRQINTDLRNLINLHRVEIIRQHLVINVQNVQANLFTVGTGFGREMDEIVESVTSLDISINKCSACHHREKIKKGIIEVQDFIEQYKEALSAYITTTANEQRVRRLKAIAADIGEMILERTREMAYIANRSLQRKTEDAVSKVGMIQNLLITTFLLTMLIGFVVAASLTKAITSRLDKLMTATKEISSGNLGYTTQFTDHTEFGEFARTFNEMSLSLKGSHEKIVSYTHRLSALVRVTVSLYSASDMDELLKETIESIGGIVEMEQADIMLFDEHKRRFCIATSGSEGNEACITEDTLTHMYEHSNKKAIIVNDISAAKLPFGELDLKADVRNMMVVWLKHKAELRGALIIVNKADGNFDTEDLRLISLLANNFTVALENLALYNDLRRKMRELRDAQQQLIQATKLAAIGELASNVAHEINNPLTSILGFAELIKEEEDIKIILQDVEIIEQESLRAREIVTQLLEFSKKKPLELKETDINELVKDVLKLVMVNIKSTDITLTEDYGEIQVIMADRDQLKQVFLNLINNAIAVMGKSGTLTLKTERSDNSVLVSVADTGAGIDEEILPRIFEPFFTTKKEKGTGIGLSVSYKIIDAHGGRIDVESQKGEGSTFIVVLPVRKAVSHVSP